MTTAAPEFDEVWRWDGWTATADSIADGAIDLDGDVVLVGAQGYEASTLDDDAFVEQISGDFAAVKLDGTSGAEKWTWTASSLGDYVDLILAVDTDSKNDVIMVGKTEGYWDASNEYNTQHLAVVKLDGGTAEEIWRLQEGPSASTTFGGSIWAGLASGRGVAVDGDDNVIVVGQAFGSLVDGDGSNQNSDYFVMKLDGTDGDEIWTVEGGLSTDFDSLRHVVVDSSGDIVGAGIGGDEDAIDFVVVKYSGATGSLLWEYSPTTSTHDVAYAIDVDVHGDVYVAGSFDAENLQGLIAETPAVLKLEGGTGDVIWTYEGAASSRAAFKAVAVDAGTGWVVGAGVTEGTWVSGEAQGDRDMAAVVLDGATGVELSRYQTGTTGDDWFQSAGFDSEGALVLGGSSSGTGDPDFVAIKFDLGTISAVEDGLDSTNANADFVEWQIGAMIGGAAVLVTLLGLCLFCLRRRRSQAQGGSKRDSGASSRPVESFNYPTIPRPDAQALPQPQLEYSGASSRPVESFNYPPVHRPDAQALPQPPFESVATEMPAAGYETTYRQHEAAAVGMPLPAYTSPQRPQHQAAAVATPVPPYKTPSRRRLQAADVGTPLPAYKTPNRPI